MIPITLISLLLLISPVFSSQGDQSPSYQRCLKTCTTSCSPSPNYSISIWSCTSNCAYSCSQNLTNLALSYTPELIESMNESEKESVIGWGKGGELEGLKLGKMVQFHGKWPFVRYFYMQEIASVLFSILNGLQHYNGFKSLKRIKSKEENSNSVKVLKLIYLGNSLIGMNAWFWSTIFHTRDLPWTERGDYFSATTAMLFGLYLVLVRTFNLYNLNSKFNIVKLSLLSVLVVATLVYHCTYLLSRERFDYGYNMKFNLCIGISSILLWFYWSYTSSPSSPSTSSSSSSSLTSTLKAPHYLLPLSPLITLFLLSFLETFDFAPIPNKYGRLIDAHALWHFGTIFVVRQWYGFLRRDLDWVNVLVV